jgi:hypothetical protein
MLNFRIMDNKSKVEMGKCGNVLMGIAQVCSWVNVVMGVWVNASMD